MIEDLNTNIDFILSELEINRNKLNEQNVDQIGGEVNRERERFYYGRFLTFGLGNGFFPPPSTGGSLYP